MLSRLLLFAAVLVVAVPCHAFAQETAEHKHDEKDHKAATMEHMKWHAQIMKMKAEHRSALAALAEIRTELLQHEAELEWMDLTIMNHQTEIAMHEQEGKEDQGKGDRAEAFEKEHAGLMANHEKLKKAMAASASHHTTLIDEIIELVTKHRADFHSQEKSDSAKGSGSKTDAKMMGNSAKGSGSKASHDDHSHDDHSHDDHSHEAN